MDTYKDYTSARLYSIENSIKFEIINLLPSYLIPYLQESRHVIGSFGSYSEPFYKCITNKIILLPARVFQGLQLPIFFLQLRHWLLLHVKRSFCELPPPVNHSKSLIRALPRRLWHPREWCFYTLLALFPKSKTMSADMVKREACCLLGNTLKGRFLQCGFGGGGGMWKVLWECWVIRSRAVETCCAWENGFQSPTPGSSH